MKSLIIIKMYFYNFNIIDNFSHKLCKKKFLWIWQDKARNAHNIDFKHVYVYQDLSEPGAERILETEELMSCK